jgi:hypothetical protein
MHVVERPGRAPRISGTVSERLTQGIPSLGRPTRLSVHVAYLS